MKNVARVLKNPSLSDAAINAGKNQLKLQILSEADAGTSLGESLAAQALYTGSVASATELAKQVDKISSSDVSAVSIIASLFLSTFWVQVSYHWFTEKLIYT